MGVSRDVSRFVRRPSVRRALDQFHELGRDAFLERYGFGKARDYFAYDREGALFFKGRVKPVAVNGIVMTTLP